jgi:hypothetical protein
MAAMRLSAPLILTCSFLMAATVAMPASAQDAGAVNNQPVVTSAQPPEDPTHDISKVDPAPIGGAISTPMNKRQQRRMKKYEIPELVGARQALGSQLIDGRLPKPLLDLVIDTGKIGQRISLFEGGLTVVRMTGAGTTIRKRVILPEDALKVYLKAASSESLDAIRQEALRAPSADRRALLRVYKPEGTFVERYWDPNRPLPKLLTQQIAPLQDLLRAISEDREVTNTVARYEPKVGDELVADDRRTWRVERIMPKGSQTFVELRCLGQPRSMYVEKKDLYQFFIGAAGAQ